MAELEKLTWRDVGEEYIEIGRAIAKNTAAGLFQFAILSALG
jgi:hypothetical protein